MDPLDQFYPTPEALALKAIEKFERFPIRRLLEPSGGKGDLIKALKSSKLRGEIDSIEINPEFHDAIRRSGARVVGFDFLKFEAGAMYSHILLNPPFITGVDHVLHAWKILFDGEIVAIINADSLKNRFSAKRDFLSKLIDENGSVELVTGAFSTDSEAERTAEVEVAIIHLKKRAKTNFEYSANLKSENVEDEITYERSNEIAIKGSTIKQWVANFNATKETLKSATVEMLRAEAYASMFGCDFLKTNTSFYTTGKENEDAVRIQDVYNERYEQLKEAAWRTVIQKSEVLKKLSKKAKLQVESEFELIRQLEFTIDNIYGFIEGVLCKQQDLQSDMILEVFDSVTQYHSDNRVYHMGWKSNDAHRVNGFKIRCRRFIMPFLASTSYGPISYLEWRDKERLADFDRVFAILDGTTTEQVYGLAELFEKHFDALASGERLSCDYFDIRIYVKRGTIHFFPRREDLVEKLNRFVGRKRNWIPYSESEAGKGFWDHYSQAEEVDRKAPNVDINEWKLEHGTESQQQEEHRKIHDNVIDGCKACNIDTNNLISHHESRQPLALIGAV